mmetsp:Transcript_27129/g.59700  ORF Transcript_27129/g.59700 Transcript_27129/m.59700 type:complete len:80 (-) Transcript_27129:439-678(-)
MLGNAGKNAWACSEFSQGLVSDDDIYRDGSLRVRFTARFKNRAASHLVRGANRKFQNLGGILLEEEFNGIAQSVSPPAC